MTSKRGRRARRAGEPRAHGRGPILGVGAIVFRGDEVLLVRRALAPARGRWSVPGGRVEHGEGLREACRRELREETGLRARLGTVACVFERVSRAGHFVIVDFVGEAGRTARPRPGGDAAAARFFAPRAVARLRTTRGLRAVLRLARARQKAGRGPWTVTVTVDGGP